MKRIATLMILLIAMALPAAAQEYADGIYRGFYYDGGIEQIAIQFELKDGKFDSLVYRGVKYKDGDYMSEDASDAQKASANTASSPIISSARAFPPSTTSIRRMTSWRISTR